MTLNIKKSSFFDNKKNSFINFTRFLFFISIWLGVFASIYEVISTEKVLEKSKILNKMEFDINQYPVLTATLDNPEFPYMILRNIDDSVLPIGQYLYIEFFIFFFLAALILLIAMIGSILIAQQEKTAFKKQNSFEQTNKGYNQCITLISK
jgi:SNF family Na+-dependent transporter